MSVATAIENLSGRIQDAYTALSAKGATMPATKNSYNLSATVDTITELKAQDKGVVLANKTTDNSSYSWGTDIYTKTITPDSGFNGISSIQFQYKCTRNVVVTPSTSQQIIESTTNNGYVGYSNITVKPVTNSIDSNIQAGNIKNGVTILGITGNLVPGITPSGNIQLTSTAQTNVTNYATAQVVDADLIAGNIKKDVNILGIIGTYEGEGGGGDIVFGMSKQYSNTNTNPDPDAIQIYVDGQRYYGATGFCIKNPTSIQFDSYYWGDNPWLRLKYADGTTQDIRSAVTITNLTQSVVVQEYHGYSCLDENTEITMRDWNKKPISKISIGDEILCLNPETMKFDYDIVDSCDSDEIKWHNEKDIWKFDDGTEITTIHPHEFYNITHQKFMYIADFRIGDKIYKLDGTTPKLVEHENVKENVRHFTLFTKKFNNYFANGILTGNRHSTVIKSLEG